MTITKPQPRILVIDDDATIPALVASLDPSWEIVVAVDGLRALDVLEQRPRDELPFDLVLLDIEMPDLDGYDTCLQIRARDHKVRILPLTRRREGLLQRFANQGLCEPPVHKEDASTVLKQRIVQALQAPAAAIPGGDEVWERLQQKSHLAVREARHHRAQVRRLAIFGRAVVHQAGLRHILNTVERISVDAVVPSKDDLLLAARSVPLHLVVAQAVDAHDALAASHAVGLPLLVVVSSPAEGQAVLAAMQNTSRQASPTGVVVVGSTIPPTLSAAVASLAEGQPYIDAMLARSQAGAVLDIARQSAVFAELPPRQAELVALDLLGWSTQEIAAALHIEPKTITKYWKRIYERLQMNRDEVRSWAQRRIAATSPASPEVSPLLSPYEDSTAA